MYFSRLTRQSTRSFSAQIDRLRAALAEAEAIVVGAGAGLSTAAGYTYSGERFERLFGDFAARYGFSDMYAGGFYPYDSLEEYWAFWSRYVMCNRYEPTPKPVHEWLLALVHGRDYFVITTNVDHCFQRAGFDKQRLFYTQGDYGLFQCSRPCCQQTWDNEQAIRAMVERQKDLRIPSELVPHCPNCGAPMTMNLRCDDTFVEDEGWHRAASRYNNFLRRHEGMRTLLLELGVGGNTPGIIKYPFWQMCAGNPQATYACVNLGEAVAPVEIDRQAILIDAGADVVLDALA
ncbi:Sir2 family NAD-dependent protein deacetylase [uncultured Parolsenella sp.]|uniref:SIR2 family NAD-dependent protein deacylase n=1 Tax=uncultured Parolsenella sp. TaxID=2083008 RepID=UPI0027DD74A6|nr:Sir2 family NAD-dependent protein deacetylase [uncultured Parolsenella sp.]